VEVQLHASLTSAMSGLLHIPAALHQKNSPRYSLDRRLGGPKSRSSCGGKGKKSLPLIGIECQSSSL